MKFGLRNIRSWAFNHCEDFFFLLQFSVFWAHLFSILSCYIWLLLWFSSNSRIRLNASPKFYMLYSRQLRESQVQITGELVCPSWVWWCPKGQHLLPWSSRHRWVSLLRKHCWQVIPWEHCTSVNVLFLSFFSPSVYFLLCLQCQVQITSFLRCFVWFPPMPTSFLTSPLKFTSLLRTLM